MKTIQFYTENGGVNPQIRKGVKEQALNHTGIKFGDDWKKIGDFMCYPIAIDEYTQETIYLKVAVSVGRATETTRKPKKVSETINVPDLF